MELSVQQYLDSVSNPRTKKGYKKGIKEFCEWFGKPAEEILQMRKEDLTQRDGEDLIEYKNRASRFEKEIEKFHADLLKKHPINTARNYTLGIRQLFRYYEMPVRFRTGSKVGKTVKTTRNFPLTIEHVRKMYDVADLRERVLLSMATDLGLRIGDFIGIKKQDMPVSQRDEVAETIRARRKKGTLPLLENIAQDVTGWNGSNIANSVSQEPPIAIDIMTGKEEVVAYGFLSQETIDLLKVYLPTLTKKGNPYLFPSNGKSHISDEWVNKLLKRLAKKAKIPLNGKSLTFHCFRKMFMSASIDSGIGLTAGKKLCGKAIAQSDDTYLTTVNLRKKFIQLKRFLTIKEQPRIDTNQLEALKDAVTKLQEDLTRQKLITDTITQDNLKTKEQLDKLQYLVEFVNSFDDYQKLKTILDFFKEQVLDDYRDLPEKLRPNKSEFSPYIALQLKKIAETIGITEKEALKRLFLDDVEAMKKADANWTEIEKRLKPKKAESNKRLKKNNVPRNRREVTR
jgi:integrase